MLVSFSSFSACSLDGRPAEFSQSILSFMVTRCKRCDHCAEDIQKSLKKNSAIVMTNDYQKQLNSTLYTSLTNRFLCQAILLKAHNNFACAGIATVSAAWCCDDERHNEQARECRKNSIVLLEQAIAIKQSKSKITRHYYLNEI